MEDISGFGLKVRLLASVTFPSGFDITQFADDGDPLEMPSIQIADKAMGMNGDLIVWSKATPIEVDISVIPAASDDVNLSILFQANRVGRGKVSARDRISLVVTYPNGKKAVFSNGKITDGMPSLPVASAGRMKTKAYKFVFENYVAS